LEKRLKKVVRNFCRWIDRKEFLNLWASKNLVGSGHPRPSAPHLPKIRLVYVGLQIAILRSLAVPLS